MGLGDFLQFFLGFGKGDVEAAFVLARAFEQELEGEGGFAHAGIALKEV